MVRDILIHSSLRSLHLMAVSAVGFGQEAAGSSDGLRSKYLDQISMTNSVDMPGLHIAYKFVPTHPEVWSQIAVQAAAS